VTAYNTFGLESEYSNIVSIPEWTPPTVTLFPTTSPTILASQTFTGTVSDNLPGVSVTIQVGTATPVLATISGTDWTSPVTTLAIGANTITVTATDAAGNITIATPATITVYRAGAANTDGTITISDAQLALTYALGLTNPTAEQYVRSDVAPVDMSTHLPKPDGKIDVDDVIVMLRRAAGLPW
jgi:hypothetical protein